MEDSELATAPIGGVYQGSHLHSSDPVWWQNQVLFLQNITLLILRLYNNYPQSMVPRETALAPNRDLDVQRLVASDLLPQSLSWDPA